jgi:4-amino-4-deoxy-L-arabinose transferase-like glycosyltransferase
MLLAVFGVALIVRLVLVEELWNLPIVRTPKLDSAEYVSWARRLAAGDFAWPIVSQHGPGYPFFLAGLLAIASGSLHAALFAQAAVGAATAALVAAIARELLGARIGVLAGLVYALYGPAVYIETAFLSEGLLLFLLMVTVFALCQEPLTSTRVAAAGSAFGAAALVRPTALVIAAACAGWIVISARLSRTRAWTMAAMLTVACLLVMSPALLRNWSVSHTLGACPSNRF